VIFLNNLKIGSRLTLAFFILLILVAILSVVATKNMGELSARTEKLYKHPFTVSTAILRIDRDIFKLNNAVKTLQIAKNPKEKSTAMTEVSDLQKHIKQDFKLISERFLGDKAEVETTQKLFDEWRTILDEQTTLLQDERKAKQLARIDTESEQLIVQLERQMADIVAFAKNKADEFLNNANVVSENTTALFSKMYKHPFTVNSAMLRIERDMSHLSNIISQLKAIESIDEKTVRIAQSEKYITNIMRDFELVLDRFLGDKISIETAKNLFEDWRAVLTKEMKLLQNTEREQNIKRLRKEAARTFRKLEKNIKDISIFINNKTEDGMPQYPGVVSTAILRIDRDIIHLNDAIKMLRFAENDNDEVLATAEFDKHNVQIIKDFELILQHFSDDSVDKELIEATHNTFLTWQAMLTQESAILKDNQQEQVLKQLDNKSAEILTKLNREIKKIIDFANNKAEEFLKNAKIAGEETSGLFNKMYQHPFTVSKAVLRINSNISHLRDAIERISLEKNSIEKQQYFLHAKELEENILADFRLTIQRFLGNKKEITNAQEMFIKWKSVLDKKTVLLSDTQQQKMLEALNETADKKLVLLDKRMDYFVTFAGNQADEFLTIAQAVKNDSLHFMYGLIAMVMIIGIAFSVLITRSIVKPLKQAVHFSTQLAAGQLSTRIVKENANDESNQLLKTMNDMANKFQTLIEEVSVALDRLAKGDTETRINVDFVGDFSKIKTALDMTAAQLSKAKAKNLMETWAKIGQSELNSLMRGEQEVAILAKKVISFLTTYVDAQIGLFYIVTDAESPNEKPFLEIIASYAYMPDESVPTRFKIGEGLVGQVALDKAILRRTHEPEEYAYIVQSGLAQAVPHHVILLPFLYENTVRGVIEIGSCIALTDIQRKFLEQVMPTVGIAVNATESRDKMQTLLHKTQTQSKELRKKSEALERQQSELMQTNEELQTQSEELQTQQEELRQANEELEIRTLDLEQQKNEISRKNREIELASKYKSEFLANMSHELRTPLNSLLILAQILSENRNGNLTEKQVGYTKTIYSAGSDLLVLINEILDLSKVESGRIEIHVESLVMGDFIEATEQKFRPIAEEKGLVFDINISEDFPQLLRTDKHRLKQILNNLLSNAFKFTSEGSVTLLLLKSTSDFKDLKKPLAIRVIDTGIGIPKDKQRLIFEAFQQADGTTSRKYGGTGLGLSISRQLANLLGGDLVLKSEENRGSTFTLYLPENPPDVKLEPVQNSIHQQFINSTKSVPSEPVQKKQMDTPNPNVVPEEEEEIPVYPDDRENLKEGDQSILIIEDDKEFLDILVNLVRERNFKVIVAEDGTTGLHLTEQYMPNAIILDVSLPKLDGWGVMERLKNNSMTRHIPVHFMSATDHSLDAKRMGAIGYLSKPVNMGELDKAFKRIEKFISDLVKKVLLVSTSIQRKQQILDLIQDDYNDVEVTTVGKYSEIKEQLQTVNFDCMIVDMGRETKLCSKLLKEFADNRNQHLFNIPIIIYANRELNQDEESALKHCENIVTIKSVHSPERLLDETTLFLHQLESKLPKEKRKMLKLVHDKEAILENKKVMIVDDDIRNTFALMSFLEGKEMEVIVGHNGKEALELLEEEENQDVALVLMDIMMPEMDGYETIKKIRAKKHFRQLPIIALTAKAMKGDRGKCIEAGANDYISKPVDTDKLLSLMRVWLYR